MPVDALTPLTKLSLEGLPVGVAQHVGDSGLIGFVFRQHLRLAVGDSLDGVLGVAQECITLSQLGDHGRGQVALAFQGSQHLEQGPLLQAEVAAAVDQLEGLGDELHFANAACAQLDVVRHALAPHFLLDQLLHGAQGLDGREVQVPSVDERAQHFLQLGAGRLIACHYPGLDHGVAFPVAALVLVILLQRVEAEHQRTGRPVRAQAHVDAKHEAIDRDRVQGLDQALPQAGEELLVIQRAFHAFGFAAFGECEDQVDVRGKVQLPRTQLAHAQHHHVLWLAAAVADRRAELLAVAWIQPLVGLIDGGVGQVGEVAAGLTEIGLAGDVTPDDAYLLAVAFATQVTGKLVLALRRLGNLGHMAAQLALPVAPFQLAAAHQAEQQPRVTLHLGEHEVTDRRHLIELPSMLLAPAAQVQFRVCGHRLVQKLLVAQGQWLKNGRQLARQRQAHGLSLIGVKWMRKGGQGKAGPRLDCHTKVGNS